jgi:hypothetical protein
MNIGVTGHQHRAGIDWPWVKQAIRAQLANLRSAKRVFSSLATGSDQIFAEVAIGLSLPVTAVVPLEGYERYFEAGDDLAGYRRLLAQCDIIQLDWKGDPERAFFDAGKFVVENCETLFAIWDGGEAEGLGGTADVVDYAAKHARKIVHIDPIAKTIQRR